MSEDWWRALHAERAALAQHRREYLALKASGREQTEEEGKRSDAEAEAICTKTEAATVAVWQAGAKTWADIVLFAEVARYWMWDPEDPILNARFYNCLDIHDTGLDAQALAQLVNAVLQIAGKEVRS
jgi:hypothetical protein